MDTLPKEVLEHIFITLSARDLLYTAGEYIACRLSQFTHARYKVRLQEHVRLGGERCGTTRIGGVHITFADGQVLRLSGNQQT